MPKRLLTHVKVAIQVAELVFDAKLFCNQRPAKDMLLVLRLILKRVNGHAIPFLILIVLRCPCASVESNVFTKLFLDLFDFTLIEVAII